MIESTKAIWSQIIKSSCDRDKKIPLSNIDGLIRCNEDFLCDAEQLSILNSVEKEDLIHQIPNVPAIDLMIVRDLKEILGVTAEEYDYFIYERSL